MKFLGHRFNAKGMAIDLSRIEAIENLKNPKNKKELQRLLGFINYLRAFIPNLSEITSPLRDLLKINMQWSWENVHSKCVEDIKNKLINAPILVAFDINKDVYIQTDSSKSGIGCCSGGP